MPSIHRDQLVRLAEEKAADALLLLRHGRYSNAYYLAGYSIELGLKAVIARGFQSDEIPDKNFVQNIYTHGIAKLAGLAGLQRDLEERQRSDIRFAANWSLVADWTEAVRYEEVDPGRAAEMLNALLEETTGVLPWLRTRW